MKHRALAVVAALLSLSVFLILVGVLPAVAGDTALGADPVTNVTAFAYAAAAHLVLVGLVLLARVLRSPLRRVLLVLVGLAVALLAFAFYDAATAFSDHGEEMAGAVVALSLCIAADVVAMVVSFVVAASRNESRTDATVLAAVG
jgi:peptidoglycan/LPS O-acetylase OafA/YrhL